MANIQQKKFTGGKMLAVMLSFFGFVISVNFYMAYSAISTFPGLEEPNTYVASQEFNDRLYAQRALGWTIDFTREGDELVVDLRDANGAVVIPASIVAKIGRPTVASQDLQLDFRLVGDVYRADAVLANGPWRLFLDAVAQDGTRYRKRLHLTVED